MTMRNVSAMNEKVQLPALSPEIVEKLKRGGYNVCYVAYYSSKSEGVLKGVVHEATRYHLHPDGLVDIINMPEIRVPRSIIQAHFVDDAYQFMADRNSKPLRGSYLRIMCPISNWDKSKHTEEALAAKQSVETSAAVISLLHGEFVALELHYSAVIILSTNGHIVESGSTYVRQTHADEHLNQAMARVIDEERGSDFEDNKTAMSLIRRAHQEKDNSIKFLFLWFALESILGPGHKRKRFALDVMKSEALNDVMNELRSMRNGLVHDGTFVELTHQIYLKIKAVCIMGLTNNQKLRDRLLNFILVDLAS